MQIDLRTVSITPLRQTFDHVAKRLGGDKPASRYQEGTLDVQAKTNYHYRPTWDPAHKIFDETRTAIKMKDWYAFKDPRQFYYGSWTQARARLQETAEGDIEFVESRGLASNLSAAVRKLALELYVPLRHVEWGANMNNASICAYGFGTAITAPAQFQGMDRLGSAQYLSRLGLLLGGPDDLAAAKNAWLNAPAWQELRRYVEDTFVLSDWFELYVAQNLALDGLMFPLLFKRVDDHLTSQAGPTVSMLTRFQADWFVDASKWVDATIKTAAAESAENKAQLEAWTRAWTARAAKALQPVVAMALGDAAAGAMEEAMTQFKARCAKAGLSV
ncbi:MAG TPA: aromatic/alkene monooxygenase hydroxylase subunit beta [Rhodocyclaceae bacterium]|nr:aromatic/alkene monooxygenase hydroxylase subunit beta [Rhodocyclaceae bacterium]